MLYSRALLLIHSTYNSLHSLTLNSQSIPSHPYSLLAIISQLSVFLNLPLLSPVHLPPILPLELAQASSPHQSSKVAHVQVSNGLCVAESSGWFSVLKWRGLPGVCQLTASSSLTSLPGLQPPCSWACVSVLFASLFHLLIFWTLQCSGTQCFVCFFTSSPSHGHSLSGLEISVCVRPEACQWTCICFWPLTSAGYLAAS